jgi:hypothetical protein
MAKRMEDNLILCNIVPLPIRSGSDTPLALSVFYTGELFDVESATHVGWILFQSDENLLQFPEQRSISHGEGSNLTLKRRSG